MHSSHEDPVPAEPSAESDAPWFALADDELSTLSGAIFMPAEDRLTATRRAVEAIIRVRGCPIPPVESPERACPSCANRWSDSMVDCPMCGTVGSVIPPASTKDD